MLANLGHSTRVCARLRRVCMRCGSQAAPLSIVDSVNVGMSCVGPDDNPMTSVWCNRRQKLRRGRVPG